MQLKWLVHSAEKLDILFFCKLFPRFISRCPFSLIVYAYVWHAFRIDRMVYNVALGI